MNKRIALFKELLEAVALIDVARIPQLINTCLKEKMGTKKVIKKIHAVAAGEQGIRSYNVRDYELSLFLLRIGGNQLVNIFHKATNLPSLRSVRRFASQLKVRVSPGVVMEEELLHNLSTFGGTLEEGLDATIQPTSCDGDGSSSPACYSTSQDETACEGKVQWDFHSNCWLGVCKEHGDDVEKIFETEEDLDNLVQEFIDGKWHRCSKASFVVYNKNTRNYGCRIMSISGCCGSGMSDEMIERDMRLHDRVFGEWLRENRPNSVHVTSNSDGDAGRRKNGSKIYNESRLLTAIPELCAFLPEGLRWFHYGCSECGVVQCFDPKHIWKRIKTWLTRAAGIKFGQALLTPSTHLEYLRKRHPTVSEDEWNHLFWEADAQNVPTTTRLINYFIELRDLPEPPSDDLTGLVQYRAYQLLANFLDLILLSFVNPENNLADQLSQLTTAAVILYACYKQEGGHFCPWQLFHDLQTTISAAWVSTLRQLQVDPTGEVFLGFLGSDRLEGLFSIIRCLKGNQKVFDLLQ
ncbi:hypothetical protein BT69DRAFT_1234149, partial [Atractiella rhizophila]